MGNENSDLSNKTVSTTSKRNFGSEYGRRPSFNESPLHANRSRRNKTEYSKDFDPNLLNLDIRQFWKRDMLALDRQTSLDPPTKPLMTPWNYCCQGKDWGIEGQEQSPIDIPINTVIYSHSHSLDIQWINQKVPLRVLNNGFNVIFNGNISKMDGVTEIGNKLTFECIQFHFHSPGEHLLDGKQYPLELHIVHQIVKEKEEEIVKRNLAVIGIFFEVDDNATPHPFLESLSLDNLQENIEFNPYEFFSQIVKPEFYNYSGGLTTPPCAESVNWFVLSKPLKMTTDQLVRFSNLNESLPYVVGSIGNYRECQPLNGRQIYCGNCEKKIEVLKEPEEQSLFSKMD